MRRDVRFGSPLDLACRDLANAVAAHPAGVDDVLRRLRGAPIARG